MAKNSDFNKTTESDCLVVDEAAVNSFCNDGDLEALNIPMHQDCDNEHSMTNSPAEDVSQSDIRDTSDTGNLVNNQYQSHSSNPDHSSSSFVANSYESTDDSPMMSSAPIYGCNYSLSAPATKDPNLNDAIITHDTTTTCFNQIPMNSSQGLNNSNTVNPESNMANINNPETSTYDKDHPPSNSDSSSKEHSFVMDNVLSLEQDLEPKHSTPAKTESDVELHSHFFQSTNTSHLDINQHVGTEPLVKSYSEKPPYTYVAMTVMAIHLSGKHGLTAEEIRSSLQLMFPYFRFTNKTWKSNFRTAINSSNVLYKVKSGEPKRSTYFFVDYSKVHLALFMKQNRGQYTFLYQKFLHEELGVPPVVLEVPKRSVDLALPSKPSFSHQSKLMLDESSFDSIFQPQKDVITTPALSIASTISDAEETIQNPMKRQKIDHEPSKLIGEPNDKDKVNNAGSEVLHHQLKQTMTAEPMWMKQMTSTTPDMNSKFVAMETSTAMTTSSSAASTPSISTDCTSSSDPSQQTTFPQTSMLNNVSNFNNYPYYSHHSNQFYHGYQPSYQGYHNYYPNMTSMYSHMPFHQPQNLFPPFDPSQYMNPITYNNPYYGQASQELSFFTQYTSHMMPNVPVNPTKPDNNSSEMLKDGSVYYNNGSSKSGKSAI